MKAAIYARVSTSDGRQDNDNQLSELRRFASAQGWAILHEYRPPFLSNKGRIGMT